MNNNTKVLYQDHFLTISATQHKTDVVVHAINKHTNTKHTSTVAVLQQAVIIGAKSLGYKVLPLNLKR